MSNPDDMGVAKLCMDMIATLSMFLFVILVVLAISLRGKKQTTKSPITYVKTHPEAELRVSYASPGIDLKCLDVLPTDKALDFFGQGRAFKLVFHVRFKIPEGHVGILKDRSGSCYSFHHVAGVIDPDYRGEVMAIIHLHAVGNFHADSEALLTFLRNKLIGKFTTQMLVVPVHPATVVSVQDLPLTERADKGFGSSDKKGS